MLLPLERKENMLNTNQLLDPVMEDNHTIKCIILGGRTVKVSRRLSGWVPWMSVSINGMVVHDSPATDDDINAFNLLQERAFNDIDKYRQNMKEHLQPSINLIFTK